MSLAENKNPLTHPKLANLPPNKNSSFKVKKSTSVGSLPNIETTQMSTNAVKKSLMALSKVDMAPVESEEPKKINLKNMTMKTTQRKWASVNL